MTTKLTKKERRLYLIAAKELCYPAETIKKIKEAKTEEECERALHDARKHM